MDGNPPPVPATIADVIARMAAIEAVLGANDGVARWASTTARLTTVTT